MNDRHLLLGGTTLDAALRHVVSTAHRTRDSALATANKTGCEFSLNLIL